MNAPRRDALLSLVLLVGVTLWMVQAHWQSIDLPKAEQKEWLHERVLQNEAADPYQYKLWLISVAMEGISVKGDVPIRTVFFASTLLSLLFLTWAHFAWLRALANERTALLGAILLGALANALFLIYYHHPYEFWGVGLFCLLLRGVQRDWSWKALVILCLVTGLVWEKHALVPVLWGLYALQRGRPFGANFLRGIAMLVAALAIPLFVRWHLGTDRAHIDGDTPWAVQEWAKVAWFQAPFIVPFLLIFVTRYRTLPAWVRWLWMYLPVLVLAYSVKSYILHEARSFWALAPVFTATFCCWWAASAPPSIALPDTPGSVEDPA